MGGCPQLSFRDLSLPSCLLAALVRHVVPLAVCLRSSLSQREASGRPATEFPACRMVSGGREVRARRQLCMSSPCPGQRMGLGGTGALGGRLSLPPRESPRPHAVFSLLRQPGSSHVGHFFLLGTYQGCLGGDGAGGESRQPLWLLIHWQEGGAARHVGGLEAWIPETPQLPTLLGPWLSE